MLLRRSIAIATIALAATGVSASPAFAKASSKHTAHAARAEKAKKSFVLVGTVTVASADSVSLKIMVKGGNQRALRGKEQAVTVAPAASIQRNDAAAVLGDLKVGDHVMVKGATKADGTFTASKVRAEAAEAPEATEAPKTPEAESHPAP